MTNLTHGSVARLFLWVYAAPVLGYWVILSFIPLAGLLIEGSSSLSVIGDAVFLALGFGGLFTLYLAAVFFAAGRDVRTKIYGSLRGRVGLVSGYATLWLVGYWLFKYLIV